MKRILFSVAYPDRLVHPLHRRVVEEPSVTRAELLMWSPTEDATTLLWCDGDRADTERVVAGIDSLVTSHFVGGTDGTYVFLRQDGYEFSATLLDIVADSRVIFLPPVVFSEDGTVEFEAVGESTALSAFYEALSELGSLTIERVSEFERRNSPSQLTSRQQAALETAVSVGYYEVPRDGSVENVADELDCSTSTAGELIRKAEAAVISAYTETT
ncbi:bacterio-opsin activator [Haloferax mediterranei ATCC 33500]|nr:helix-turn-helix domain-containing protein [Haloferax mediterranei]AHZ23724.1 bacterio-opsin activator [Haloferax mediterranei ATCC 33500]